MQEEIRLQLLAMQQRTRLLEGQVADLQQRLEQAGEGQQSSEPDQGHGDPPTNKLYRDLEMQTHLIDQLNDESIPRGPTMFPLTQALLIVNGLKRRMQDMVEGRDGSDGYLSKYLLYPASLGSPLPTTAL